MPTNKTRINITIPDYVKMGLVVLAKRENIAQATKAARLLETALEMEEDQVWDKIASLREAKKTNYVPHSKAWQ